MDELDEIREAQKETSLLLKELVGKAREDNQLFKEIISRLDALSSRVSALEEKQAR